MTDLLIALNRFGLGGRVHDPVPSDPRGWLLGQLHRYDSRPPHIAAIASSAQVIGQMNDAYAARREFKADKSGQGAAAALSDPLMAGAAPAMAARLGPASSVATEAAAQAVLLAGGPKAAGFFRDIRQTYVASVGARTTVAAASDTPFAERLVAFWSNHFALSVDKQTVVGLAGPFEFEAIRPHIMGTFANLLLSVESHPAMLLYLDQAQSIGPNSMAGTRAAKFAKAKRGLNENLAREILELHTLGVRTGYSQTDVTEFARALTGWTVAGLRQNGALAGLHPGAAFVAALHEPGTRLVMGKRYAGEDDRQARAILADLAVHPATAQHIATKLARHFAADDPPPALVARLAQSFLASGGDLPTLYRTLVDSPEVWRADAPKFRNPWDWGIAAMRAVGMADVPDRAAVGLFQQLGQQIWKPGSPAGYDDISASWAAPDALLRRVEAAARMAKAVPTLDARALAPQLFPATLSPKTSQVIASAESPAQALALLLVSPEMMRR